MAIPFLVIHYNAKETWGSFVTLILFSLLALQIINWGNKEYLLRQFSMAPNAIRENYTINLITRLPLVFIAAILAVFCFPTAFGFWVFVWLLGRFFSNATEALIIYQKAFNASIAIESVSFALFCLGFWLLKIDLFVLLILYSGYQLVKGLAYFLLFRRFLNLEKLGFNSNYYVKAFPFFLLSILGFLASKVDVYLIESLGNKIVTSDYQIINSLLVFVMSISAFVYAPFTKNIYRTSSEVITKTKRILLLAGLVLVPTGLFIIYLIVAFYLKLKLSFLFYVSAFIYVVPSFLYGIEVVNLFRIKKEKTVVIFLLIGAATNSLFSYLFLYYGHGMTGALAGSAISQVIVLCLFKLNLSLEK